MKILPYFVEIVCRANRKVVSPSILINKGINGAFSAMSYYDNDKEKIISVIRSLIKNHYFRDGNKRAAFITFIALCKIFKMTFNEENLKENFVEIAENNYDVEKISSILF